MKYIKQYGLQRSGTNYLRAILELNFDCRVLSNIGGSKHERITNVTNLRQVKTDIPVDEIRRIDKMLQDGEIQSIAIIKNPHAWIVSISRYLNQPISKEFIDEQMKRYVELNNHWKNNVTYWITYEDLIFMPFAWMDILEIELGLDRTSTELILPENRMHRGGDTPTETIISRSKFNANYYKDKLYMNELTEEQIKQISNFELWH